MTPRDSLGAVDRSKSWHLSNWNMRELEYELRYQQADGIHTWGPGQCGHPARGSSYCAKCLQREIDRRQARARKALEVGGE